MRFRLSSLWWAFLDFKSYKSSLFRRLVLISFFWKQFFRISIVICRIAILFSPSLFRKIGMKSLLMYLSMLTNPDNPSYSVNLSTKLLIKEWDCGNVKFLMRLKTFWNACLREFVWEVGIFLWLILLLVSEFHFSSYKSSPIPPYYGIFFTNSSYR